MSKRSAQRHRQERRERDGEHHLDAMQVKALEAVEATVETIERKVGQDESRQPRFTSPTSIFSSVYRWALTSMAHEPGPRATVQQWDAWYRSFSQREPFLVGVLNSAVQIDRNRGWTLTGGKNQVNKYTDRLHNFDDGAGWRAYIDWQAQSYYTTRMGFVSEVGREGRNGPLSTLWSVDPCKCQLTGNPDAPLKYYPNMGGAQEWTPDLFIRGKSLVSTDEAQLTYGYPAVARCYDLAKVMVGVFSHYQQKVGTRTPDAVLTGKFIREDQWEEAVRARNEALNADPNSYLNSLATIMSSGGDMPEFALTLLSSIPDRWDVDAWTLILMRGYALAFGYQSSEFYPEPAGVMGRGKEQEIQHRSATGKGGKDFSLTHQEKLQGVLPPTLEFMYEERDVAGEEEDAHLQLAQAQVITEMTRWVVNGQSVLTVPQIMSLAAEQGVIPEEWTPQTEDVTATDEEDAGAEEVAPAALSERVQRAMMTFPDEPIARYSWPENKTRVLRTVRRRSFFFPKVIKRTVGQVVSAYNDQLTNLVYNAWNKLKGGTNAATMQTALRTEHKRLIKDLGPQVYAEGLGEAGVPLDEMDATDKENIATWVNEQMSHVNSFASDAVAAYNDDAQRSAITARVGLWVDAMRGLGSQGVMSGQKNKVGTWQLGKTERHCRTCAGLHGKRHRMSWYLERGLRPREPGSETLECKGYKCDCNIKFDDGTFLL